MTTAMCSNTTKDAAEIADDLSPFLRTYKDGSIERLMGDTFVPATEAATGDVATRDVIIDPVTGVSARLFLSVGAVANGNKTRLPIIVYFHGGGFCTGSAFSKLYHRYAASLSARAGALVVSVDYRLAPEHPIIPAAYDDAWAALRWVTSLSDRWIAYHGDHTRGVFVAGESAGANIAHNVVARAASPDDIEGMILLQPFFWGSDRLPFEADWQHGGRKFTPETADRLCSFLTAGNDDAHLNPRVEQVASLPCRRAIVSVASKDVLRDRGRRYAAWLRRYGKWCHEVAFVESEGEDHVFHLYRPARASAVALMDSIVKFIDNRSAPSWPATEHDDLGLAVLAANSGANIKKTLVVPRSTMSQDAFVVRPRKSFVPKFGLMMTRSKFVVPKNDKFIGHAVFRRTGPHACMY